MKIKTTHAMAKAMNEEIHLDCIDRIKFRTMPLDRFHFYVRSEWYTHPFDYQFDKNYNRVGRCIEITYKPDCYASPKYLTYNDLATAYTNSDSTYKGFFEELSRMIEI